MESQVFLIQIVLILFAARFVGELAAYVQIPAVIGELAAGMLIGPSVLGIIELTPSINLLAQIGIILLLFEVGLETDISRLAAAGFKAGIVATGGVVIPFFLGFLISVYLFHFNLITGLFVGCTLTATSIGITLRVLRDLKKQNSQEAQVIIGAAVLDDIIGIVLLSMLYDFAISGEVNILNTGKIILFIILFFLFSPLFLRGISFILEKWEKKSEIPGLLPTMIVSLILLFAWIAHELGAPELLGGFAAGMALSKEFKFPTFLNQTIDFTHRVENQMRPIIHLFTPIFFVSIGLSLNLKLVDWNSSFIFSFTTILLLVALFGKLISGFLLQQEKLLTKIIIGTAMIPRGEVGLIFANIGLETGVLKMDLYTSLILVIAFTTLFAPFFLRYLMREQKD